ncbi:MAG TPA: hypothetical protein VH951_13250 [Dehalococcoidia bacterium]
MANERRTKRSPVKFTDEEMAWIREHRLELEESVSGQGFLYMSLGMAFVAGLAAQSGGYFLRVSASTDLVGLFADLLYALGWSLWTSIVVVVFVQVIPQFKQRQIKRYLDAYEAVRRNESRS